LWVEKIAKAFCDIGLWVRDLVELRSVVLPKFQHGFYDTALARYGPIAQIL